MHRRLQGGRALRRGWARGLRASALTEWGSCTFGKLPLGETPFGSFRLENSFWKIPNIYSDTRGTTGYINPTLAFWLDKQDILICLPVYPDTRGTTGYINPTLAFWPDKQDILICLPVYPDTRGTTGYIKLTWASWLDKQDILICLPVYPDTRGTRGFRKLYSGSGTEYKKYEIWNILQAGKTLH